MMQGKMIRGAILIVDDEVSNIEIMNAILEDEYEICFATSGTDALELARKVQPDLILLDVLMPGMDGFELCRLLKEDRMLADVPVIFTTGLGDTEDEMRGLSLGAIDYVTKPVEPAILRARVANHVELKKLRDQLAAMAITDALTSLSNRRHLENTLQTEVSRLARSQDWLSVIMLDIDFFKQFNDSYGHLAGDRCITLIGAALRRAAKRASDLSARDGGEEFACVLPSTDAEGAMIVAQEIQLQVQSLAIPHEGSSISSHVTVSIGVASAQCFAGMSPEIWLSHADQQLYKSKQAGRNCIHATMFEATPAPINGHSQKPDQPIATRTS